MSHHSRSLWSVPAVVIAALICVGATAQAQIPDVTYHVEPPILDEIGNQVSAIHRVTTEYSLFASFGSAICNDPGELLPIDVDPGSSLPSASQIFFYDTYSEPGGADVACVLDGVGAVTIPTGVGQHITTVQYEVIGGTLGEIATLNYCEVVGGTVSYFNWLYFEGATLVPEQLLGYPRFKRGDGNADGEVDISDVIFGLNGIIGGGPWGNCRDALDANDDGTVNIVDPIFTLTFLFIPGSPPPPPPFTFCGDDQTPDSVDCEQSTAQC